MEEKENKELELKLRKLENDYSLDKSILIVGIITTALALIGVIVSLVAPTEKMQSLSANNIVAVIGIGTAPIAVCVYFLYRRFAAVKLKISKAKIALKMESSVKAK